MSLIINTNIASLTAQRNLGLNESQLQKSLRAAVIRSPGEPFRGRRGGLVHRQQAEFPGTWSEPSRPKRG